MLCAARSTRGATIKLKIIKNYDNGQVDGKCGAIDPAGVVSPTQRNSTQFSISLKLYIDCRQLLGCAFNENLFYAICDGVGCQVISVRGCGRGDEGMGEVVSFARAQPIACLVSIQMSFALIRIAGTATAERK